MKLLILSSLLFISSNLFANSTEFFGSSASTMGIGNQSNFDSLDAANNIYNPSILASENQTLLSANFLAIDTNFKKINNIVIQNPVNSGETSDIYGDSDTDYKNQYLLHLHTSFKIFKNIPSKLNLSFVTPIDKVLEASTGDPYRPEYVMYNSRFKRALFYISYAQKLESISVALGGIGGIQSNGETYVVAKDNGSTTPSSGKLQFNAKPSLAFTLSLSQELENFSWSFYFQDESKSKIKNTASGYTPIGSSSLKFNWNLNSLLFYDPRIYRISTHYLNYFFTLEYQDWSGYKTPTLNMKNNGGVLVSSNTEENFTTRNILIPKLGMEWEQFLFGISYRQSPLKLESGASGNSIDLNSTILSTGHKYSFSFLEQEFNLVSAFQVHLLESKTIKKSPGRENGDSNGQKIGYPEYKAGGEVYALSFGLTWLI